MALKASSCGYSGSPTLRSHAANQICRRCARILGPSTSVGLRIRSQVEVHAPGRGSSAPKLTSGPLPGGATGASWRILSNANDSLHLLSAVQTSPACRNLAPQNASWRRDRQDDRPRLPRQSRGSRNPNAPETLAYGCGWKGWAPPSGSEYGYPLRGDPSPRRIALIPAVADLTGCDLSSDGKRRGIVQNTPVPGKIGDTRRMTSSLFFTPVLRPALY